MKKTSYILHSAQIILLTAISALPLCSFAVPEPGKSNQEPKTYMKQIKDLYFQSLDTIPERTQINMAQIEGIKALFKAAFSAKIIDIPKPTSAEKTVLAFRACEADLYNKPHIISATTAQKMDLVCNSANSKEKHLSDILSSVANATDITSLLHTAAGTTYMVKQISHPHSDIKKLKSTQDAIRTLATNKLLSSNINDTLRDISKGESDFLLFHCNASILHPEMTKILYWNWISSFNDSSITLEAGRLFYPFWFISPMAVAGTACLITRKIAPMIVTLHPKILFMQVAVMSLIKENAAITKTLQNTLIGVSQYLNGAKKLYNLILANKALANNITEFAALKELAEPTEKHSTEFRELVQLLSTNTFEGNASFFSFGGRVLRAYRLMNMPSVQKEFTDIVNAIGEIDVYHALAQKIKSTEKKPVQYALVEFDTTSTTPYIEAVDLWNPFVPESKAIPNTIEMGDDKPRNIILSGPNTGGKSTLCKATLLNLILAQSFGIAAAKYMKFTPFVNLDCFMNMTDDTAGGVSGLQSEANRAEALVAAITAKPHGFHFLLLDEIFTATSPDQAEAMALKLIKYLSGLPNCMFINSVHYDGLKDFADKSKDCRNCHMGAIIDTNGKVLNTYKLAEGRSTVKNAAQVVAATGKLSFLDNIAPAA